MDIRPIRNDKDHAAALAEIERLWSAAPGTPDHDRIEVLSTLVSAYEDKRWPVGVTDPVDAIKFQMEQSGHTQSDLAKLIGSASRASEILRRVRPLTMSMAAKLHHAWRIPAECLLGAAEAPVASNIRRKKRAPRKALKPQKKAARKRA